MLGKLKNILKQYALRKAENSPLIAAIVLAFHKDYQREAWALIHGIRGSHGDGECDIGWRLSLRNHIHILEKGISAEKRRAVFGLMYIERAVNFYSRLVKPGNYYQPTDEPLKLWAHDVLTKYFDVVVTPDPVVEKARSRFNAILEEVGLQRGDPQRIPYIRSETPICTYEEMLALAKRRRSVRCYLPEPVSRDLLDRAIEVASLSPSSCNQQPFHFRIYDDPALIEVLRELPGGITAFDQVPCLVVLTGDLRGCFGAPNNRHVIYIDSCLAAMAFQFALESLGLSSCCINWAETREKDERISKLLAFPAYERVIMFLVVGYPKKNVMVPMSQKRHIDELRSFNRTPAKLPVNP